MIDAILTICMLSFIKYKKIRNVRKIAIILLSTNLILIYSINNIFVRINTYILVTMTIIDGYTYTIPNELTLYMFLVNLFSRDCKLVTGLELNFNLYSCLTLIVISFLISVASKNLGFGDFKLMLVSFLIFTNEEFLNLFFLLSILVFLYSIIMFLVKQNMQLKIAMGPFFYITYILLNT